MIVRLHNLSARPPTFKDVEAVAKLLSTCEREEVENTELTEITEEEIQRIWHAPHFHLQTDAWVIVTRKGHMVGYADLRTDADNGYRALLHVHPDYRGRGIGTLLIWLLEERARQDLAVLASVQRAVLRITASSNNLRARRLLVREGYSHVQSFWRVLIDVHNMHADQLSRSGKLRLDMVVDAQRSVAHGEQPPGSYLACQYDVYEKELCAGYEIVVEALTREPLTV